MASLAHPVGVDRHQRLDAAGREGVQLELRQQQRLPEHAARDGGPYLAGQPALQPRVLRVQDPLWQPSVVRHSQPAWDQVAPPSCSHVAPDSA